MQRTTAIKVLKAIVYAGIYGGLLMPLVFIPVVIFPFVFSKLITFQILIGLTFPAYIILAWIEPQYRPRKSLLYAAIGAYFIALLLSVIFAVDPVRAWWGNQERMNGLFTLLHFLIWLTMAVSLIKTWAQWSKLLNYQVILGVFMACVALLQHPFPTLLIFPAGGRVGGLLDNPIYMGAYQLFVLNFIALLWFKTKNNGWRVWYVIAFIFSMSSMFAAGSRGPFMGLIFGIALSAIALGIMHKSKKVRLGVALSVIAAAVIYVGIVTVGVKTSAFNAFERSFPTASRIFSLQTGTAGRFIAWNIAWQGFLERPITGWGLDDFHILFNRDYNPQSLRAGYAETWFDRAHNTVFDVVSMTGVVGFVTFMAVWIALYLTVIRARRKGYIDMSTTAILIGLPAGYFLQNIFVFDHPAAFSMSYLLYAFVICINYPEFNNQVPSANNQGLITNKPGPSTQDQVPKSVKTRPMPWVTFGVVQVGFFLVVYLTSIMPFYASYLTIKSNNAYASGNLEGMLSYAKAAAAIQTPYLDEQTFLHSRNLIAMADGGDLVKWPKWKEMLQLTRDVTERHLVTHGVNAHPRFVYASLLQSVGQAAKDVSLLQDAAAQFQAAIKESPKRQQLYFGYGRLLAQLGKPKEALDQYLEAANFDPEVGDGWWYVGISYWFDTNDKQSGAEYIIKAMTVSRPHVVGSAQEALVIAQAYDLKGDKDGLRSLIPILPTVPSAPAAVYIQVAQTMEHQGLMDERNMILGAVIRLDPQSQNQLQALIDGRAQTIEDSIKMATSSAAPVTIQPGQTIVSGPTNVATNTQTVTAGQGPRK
ncbi:MAG: O-antigen ligase family protein [Patescibacteria group bacterium]|jgi:O-antigen ligase/tetratricopeptide (TPR) repeat protein